MKRKQQKTSTTRGGKLGPIDSKHLISVRGGGLGITVAAATDPPDIMQNQHNEALVEL